MNGTALYRALVEAGTSKERAKEAAESVVYAKEGAAKADLTEVKLELSDRIAAIEVTMERNFRAMTFRLIGAFFALQALMLAALRFTGPS